MYNNNKIGEKEVVFLLVASIIEVGTLAGLRGFVSEAGTDMWIVGILGYIFFIPFSIIMIKLSLRFPTYGFGEYSRIITGRLIGFLLSIILVVYWILVNGRLLTSLGFIVKLTMLENTPTFIVIILYLLISSYMAWFGLEAICRLCTFTVIGIMPLIIIMTLTSFENFRADNLLPLFEKGVIPTVKAGFTIGISDLEEFTYLLFLIPFMSKPKKVYKATLISEGIAYSISIVAVLSLGVLGAETAKNFYLTPFVAIESVRMPDLFLERLGTIFIGLWIMIAFPTVVSLIYASSLVLSQTFKASSYKCFIIPISALLAVISLLPKSIMQSEKFYKILGNYGLAVLVVIPLLLYIIAVIRKVEE